MSDQTKKRNRVNLSLSVTTQALLRKHSEMTDIPMSRTVDRAVLAYLDTWMQEEVKK